MNQPTNPTPLEATKIVKCPECSAPLKRYGRADIRCTMDGQNKMLLLTLVYQAEQRTAEIEQVGKETPNHE
jgi:hypothetical protein